MVLPLVKGDAQHLVFNSAVIHQELILLGTFLHMI